MSYKDNNILSTTHPSVHKYVALKPHEGIGVKGSEIWNRVYGNNEPEPEPEQEPEPEPKPKPNTSPSSSPHPPKVEPESPPSVPHFPDLTSIYPAAPSSTFPTTQKRGVISPSSSSSSTSIQFKTDADFSNSYSIGFFCRVLIGSLNNVKHVLKRSPASLNNKCGGKQTTAHGMPFLCDWPVGEMVTYSLSSLLSVNLVPETSAAVLSNSKVDNSFTPAPSAEVCTGQQYKLLDMAYVKNEADLSFFSAQQVRDGVKDIDVRVLEQVAAFVLDHGANDDMNKLISRWGSAGSEKIADGKIFDQVLDAFLLDFLVDMCDRFGSNVVQFRIGFNNLLPIGPGSDPHCNAGNFVIDEGSSKLFLIDNGKSLHCRTFLDNSMRNNRKLGIEVLSTAKIAETVSLKQEVSE